MPRKTEVYASLLFTQVCTSLCNWQSHLQVKSLVGEAARCSLRPGTCPGSIPKQKGLSRAVLDSCGAGEVTRGGVKLGRSELGTLPRCGERACRHRLSAGGHCRNSGPSSGARNSPCRQLFLKPWHTPGGRMSSEAGSEGLWGSDQPGAREHPRIPLDLPPCHSLSSWDGPLLLGVSRSRWAGRAVSEVEGAQPSPPGPHWAVTGQTGSVPTVRRQTG